MPGRVQDVGFEILAFYEFRVRVQDLGIRVQGFNLGFGIWGLWGV